MICNHTLWDFQPNTCEGCAAKKEETAKRFEPLAEFFAVNEEHLRQMIRDFPYPGANHELRVDFANWINNKFKALK